MCGWALKAELGLGPCPLDHTGEPGRAEGRPALRGEHEGRLGLLLALEPPQRPKLVPEDWMGAGGALLHPADVKRPRGKLDLVPPQVHQLRGPQAVPVGHQRHRGVPVPPAVSPGGVHQPLDLGLRQVLAGAQLAVGRPLGGDCSIYGGWRDQPEVPFGHAFRASRPDDCSYNGRFMDSSSSLTGQKSLAATHPKWVPYSGFPVHRTHPVPFKKAE